MSYFGALAAARIGQIKNINRKLLKRSAISPETAVNPKDAEITSGRELRWLNRLIEEDKVGKTEDGRVWWKQ